MGQDTCPAGTFPEEPSCRLTFTKSEFVCSVSSPHCSGFSSGPTNLLAFTDNIHGEKLFTAHRYRTPVQVTRNEIILFFPFFRHCWMFHLELVQIQASFRQLWSFCIGNEHLIPRSHETLHPSRGNTLFKKILCPLLEENPLP